MQAKSALVMQEAKKFCCQLLWMYAVILVQTRKTSQPAKMLLVVRPTYYNLLIYFYMNKINELGRLLLRFVKNKFKKKKKFSDF